MLLQLALVPLVELVKVVIQYSQLLLQLVVAQVMEQILVTLEDQVEVVIHLTLVQAQQEMIHQLVHLKETQEVIELDQHLSHQAQVVVVEQEQLDKMDMVTIMVVKVAMGLMFRQV
tara:strand:+ start:236 stop:583 length:348 start_codon:yes stop_codon:yes gene_type:complete